MIYEFVAPCYFGTERSAAFDFKRIGAQEVTVTDGRVSFKGDAEVLARANIESRCAERILLLLRRAKTVTFAELFRERLARKGYRVSVSHRDVNRSR